MSLLSRFLKWWLGELIGLVPGLVKRAMVPRPATLLATDQDGLLLSRLGTRDTVGLGLATELTPAKRDRLRRSVRQGRLEVVLGVDPQQVVTLQAKLPAAAEEDLSAVLEFEIDRLTPFTADELYFAYQVVGRDETGPSIEVAVSYTPRARVAEQMSALDSLGLTPKRLSVLTEQGRPRAHNLLPQAVTRGQNFGRVLAGSLTGMAAVLLIALWAVTMHGKEQKIEQLDAQLRDARAAAVAVDVDHTASSGQSRLELEIFRAKSGKSMAVHVLARLTEALPDDTWIDSFSFDGHEVRISGQSADAVALIALFDGHPSFRDPVFSAPITRNQAGGERFLVQMTSRGPEG